MLQRCRSEHFSEEEVKYYNSTSLKSDYDAELAEEGYREIRERRFKDRQNEDSDDDERNYEKDCQDFVEWESKNTWI